MNKNPEIILMVGVAGSGKSTLIKKLLETSGKVYDIISTDAIIDEMARIEGTTYAALWGDRIEEASLQAGLAFREAILARRNIIWDQTNLKPKKRKVILSQVPNCYRRIAMVCVETLEILKERVLKRGQETGKIIPLDVIETMYEQLVMPTTEEGFDEIMLNT